MGQSLVSDNGRVFSGILNYKPLQCLLVRFRYYFCSHLIRLAVFHADKSSLPGRATSKILSFVEVPAAFFAAKIAFVYFDFAVEWRVCLTIERPNSVQHIPSRFLHDFLGRDVTSCSLHT